MKSSIAAVLLIAAIVQSAPRFEQNNENSTEHVTSNSLGYNVIPIYEIRNTSSMQKNCSPHCYKEIFDKPMYLLKKTPTSQKFDTLYLADGLKSFKPSEEIKLFQEIGQAIGIMFTKFDFPSEKYPNVIGVEGSKPETTERGEAIPYLVITNEDTLKEINRDGKYEKVAELEVSREGLVTKINFMLMPTVVVDKNIYEVKNEANLMNDLEVKPLNNQIIGEANKAIENLSNEAALYGSKRHRDEIEHLVPNSIINHGLSPHQTPSYENNFLGNNFRPLKLSVTPPEAFHLTSPNGFLDLQNDKFSPYFSNYKWPASYSSSNQNPFNIYSHSLNSEHYAGYPFKYPSDYEHTSVDSMNKHHPYPIPTRPVDQKTIIKHPVTYPPSQNPSIGSSPSESDYSQYYYNYPMTTEYSFPYGSYSQIEGYPSPGEVPQMPQNLYPTPNYPITSVSNPYKHNHQHHYHPTISSRPGYNNEPNYNKVPNYVTMIFSTVINPVTLHISSMDPALQTTVQNNTRPFIHQTSTTSSPTNSTNVTNTSTQSVVPEQPVSDQQNLKNDSKQNDLRLELLNAMKSENTDSLKSTNPPCKCQDTISKQTESLSGDGTSFGKHPPPFSLPAGYSSALQP